MAALSCAQIRLCINIYILKCNANRWEWSWNRSLSRSWSRISSNVPQCNRARRNWICSKLLGSQDSAFGIRIRIHILIRLHPVASLSQLAAVCRIWACENAIWAIPPTSWVGLQKFAIRWVVAIFLRVANWGLSCDKSLCNVACPLICHDDMLME